MNMKLEVIALPVSDIDRSKTFYIKLGFRMDIDYIGGGGYRVVQFTPPGSSCSIMIGNGITMTEPGPIRGLYLIVDDIEAARAELVERDIEIGEIFHDAGGAFHHSGTKDRLTGLAPDRKSYGSFASFSDPDGNGWFIQEVQQRLPGR